MRRLNLVLLATLQLSGSRARGFSIHQDLLALPQYEVVFSDSFVSEKDAQAILEGSSRFSTTPSARSPQPTSGDATDDSSLERAPSYEVMRLSSHRFLCSIPVVAPPNAENETMSELDKAAEAQEASRATAKGRELINPLEDSCLYFRSGWWSYSFCHNREVVQFHAKTTAAHGQPPRRDPHTAEYTLGRTPSLPATTHRARPWDADEVTAELPPPPPAELQVKGDLRYMVRRLVGGTICDLTGRERTIEIQYHCVPGMKSDRIGWIKEVTICSYVMVVNTPRLCNDVAFLPPEETKANPINCRRISGVVTERGSFIGSGLLEETQAVGIVEAGIKEKVEVEGDEKEVTAEQDAQVTIGDVVVGARRVLSGADEDGKPPVKLSAPRNIVAGQQQAGQVRLVDVLAQRANKEEGGKVKVLSAEDIQKLELKPEVIEEMRKQMEQMAGDAGWKLEIVELGEGDVRELRGYIDEQTPIKKGQGNGEGSEGGEEEDTDEGGDGRRGDHGKSDGSGSEERFFKDEL